MSTPDWMAEASAGGLDPLELRSEALRDATEEWAEGQRQLVEAIRELAELLDRLAGEDGDG